MVRLAAANRRRDDDDLHRAQQAYLTAAWSRTKRLRPFKMEWRHRREKATAADGAHQRELREALTSVAPDKYRSPTEDDARRFVERRRQSMQ